MVQKFIEIKKEVIANMHVWYCLDHNENTIMLIISFTCNAYWSLISEFRITKNIAQN